MKYYGRNKMREQNLKKINKKFVIVGIIVVLVIGFIGYSFINNNEQDDQTVIKENVISLTDE